MILFDQQVSDGILDPFETAFSWLNKNYPWIGWVYENSLWIGGVLVATLLALELFWRLSERRTAMMDPDCGFCRAAHGEPITEVVREWRDAVALVPLEPVVDGHLVVIPRWHVTDAGDNPEITAKVMRRVAELVGGYDAVNVIVSKGTAATQTMFHLHVHIVPRQPDDKVLLPWTFQVRGRGVSAFDSR